jgi:16S rRNA (guanine1516-N2)-methyltransferase
MNPRKPRQRVTRNSLPVPEEASLSGVPPGLECDFVGGAVGHRFRFGAGREPLAKAVGLTKGQRPEIVDATAGLGRDAFLLASLGLQVTLIERSREIHALLQDGLARAREAGPELAAIVGRMTLLFGDAKAHLERLRPEVVVVDPMHPPRKNTALVKQEMRRLRDVVGTDPDAPDLMRAALGAVTKRVVLKWPLRGDFMPGLRAPSHQIVSKTLRYDVFMI